jgi:thiamine-phosphate diphosphorylase
MLSKKRLLSKARLYLILDAQVNSYDELFDITRHAIPAGVDVFQLRDKHGSAKNILGFSQRLRRLIGHKAIYIVNDRIDLAILSEADGVHLGQEDVSCALARRILGAKGIIGVSCQSMTHALKAQKEGADYIGFGSVYKTQTKPERQPMDLKVLSSVVQRVELPLFAIGGIRAEHVSCLQAVGVRRVAVCRSICQSSDVAARVKEFKKQLG